MRLAMGFCVAGCLILLLSGCCNPPDKVPEGKEVASQTSPDGKSRAFVWAPDLGGSVMVSQPYQVWLQSETVEKQPEQMFVADKTEGARLIWKTSTMLEICYDHSAQIYHFQNFFHAYDSDLGKVLYSVEVVLRKVQKLSDCR